MDTLSRLEISYHRELKQNYLMIAAENGAEESFECRMLEENAIDGLLRFRVSREDSRCWFCYEITSRQPLGRLLENKSMSAGQIRTLLLGIAQTLMRMGDYLLTENQILLQPEYIYVYPDIFQPELCLLPGKDGNFPQEFSDFLQFLLGKADHQDKEAVVLIYGLYRESLKENYGLDNLLRWLMGDPHGENPGDSSGAGYQTEETARSGEINGTDPLEGIQDRNSEGIRFAGRKPEYKSGYEPFPGKQMALAVLLPLILPAALWMWQGTAGLKSYGLAAFAAGGVLAAAAVVFLLLRRRKRRPAYIKQSSSVKKKTEMPAPSSWEMVFAEDGPEPEVSNISAPPEVSRDSHTVLLWSSQPSEGVRSLVGQEGTAETIPISYYPFLIGKQENLTDYVIARDTISRLHARIDRRDDKYWLTDLNSTNGTAVNGHSLEANETVPLNIGDQVDLADLHFRFQ